VKGTQRFCKELTQKYKEKLNELALKTSPCWGEISYLNNFKTTSVQNKRSVLLGWVFSTIKNQHGFAMEILLHNQHLLPENLYQSLYTHSESNAFSKATPLTFKQRVKNKLIGMVNKF